MTLRSGKELDEVEKEPRKVVDKGKKAMEETLKEDDTESSKPAPEVKVYKLKVPFPARLKQHALDSSLLSFLRFLKSCISISLLLML